MTPRRRSHPLSAGLPKSRWAPTPRSPGSSTATATPCGSSGETTPEARDLALRVHCGRTAVFHMPPPPRSCPLVPVPTVAHPTPRLIFPIESLDEGEPLLVELWDKDAIGIEFLGQVRASRVLGARGCLVNGHCAAVGLRKNVVAQRAAHNRRNSTFAGPWQLAGPLRSFQSVLNLGRHPRPAGHHDPGQGARDRGGPCHWPGLLVRG